MRSTVAVAFGLACIAGSLGPACPSPAIAAARFAADDAPPIFRDQAFEQAIDQNKSSGKLLLVKFTAEWCGPCKVMNRTTFRDDGVVEWITGSGTTLIAVDVDAQPEVARASRIRAMPTMVAYKGGAEFDRVMGMQDAEELVAWLKAVERGERSSDRVVKRYEQMREGTLELSVEERMDLAGELSQAGRHAEATDEYAWLWENMVKEDPAMLGVRRSFLVSSMAELAAEHEPAKARFAALRDAAEARLKTDTRTFDDLRDWLNLNEATGDDERSLAWFDRIKADGDARSTFGPVRSHLEPLLERHERWGDLALLYRDPARALRKDYAQLEMMRSVLPPEDFEQMRGVLAEASRDKWAQVYRGLLLAGRDEEAAALAQAAFEADDSAEMRVAFVRGAVAAKRVTRDHHEWLVKARELGEVDDELAAEVKSAVP